MKLNFLIVSAVALLGSTAFSICFASNSTDEELHDIGESSSATFTVNNKSFTKDELKKAFPGLFIGLENKKERTLSDEEISKEIKKWENAEFTFALPSREDLGNGYFSLPSGQLFVGRKVEIPENTTELDFILKELPIAYISDFSPEKKLTLSIGGEYFKNSVPLPDTFLKNYEGAKEFIKSKKPPRLNSNDNNKDFWKKYSENKKNYAYSLLGDQSSDFYADKLTWILSLHPEKEWDSLFKKIVDRCEYMENKKISIDDAIRDFNTTEWEKIKNDSSVNLHRQSSVFEERRSTFIDDNNLHSGDYSFDKFLYLLFVLPPQDLETFLNYLTEKKITSYQKMYKLVQTGDYDKNNKIEDFDID